MRLIDADVMHKDIDKFDPESLISLKNVKRYIDVQPTTYPKPTKISYEVVTLSNYATEDLDKVLSMYGDKGYKLVSTLLAPNKFNVEVMYLFFAKEE